MDFKYREDYTIPIKQRHFREILIINFLCLNAIAEKHSWISKEHFIIDLTAGPGYHDMEKEMGSPLIILDERRKHNLYSKIVLIEKDRNSYITLIKNIEKYFPNELSNYLVSIECGDNREIIKKYTYKILPKQYGLAYMDGFGEKDADFDLLGLLCDCYKRMDLIIHCNCGSIKRSVGVKKIEGFSGKMNLEERISLVYPRKKAYGLVRIPYTQWQWSIFIFTNWDAYPKFRSLGFSPIDSPEGQTIIKKLSQKGNKNESKKN